MALINVPSTGVPELAYIQPDHLGTPRVAIDPARNVTIWEWSNKSEAFGDQAPANDPDGDGVTFELSLRFPGQQATDASGLFYNYQREYDPAVGRYSQSDPIGLSGGINTYLYAGSGPVARVDPLGLDYLVIGGGVREGSLNFFGHVGIAISDNGMYSYGNDTPLGSSPLEYLRSQSKYRNQTVVLVPATPQQSLASAQYLSRAYPGMNSVGFFDNCAVRSNEGLMAGGMSTLQSPFPGGMTRAASRLPGARTFYIPKGGDIPKELLDALPGYENKASMSGGDR